VIEVAKRVQAELLLALHHHLFTLVPHHLPLIDDIVRLIPSMLYAHVDDSCVKEAAALAAREEVDSDSDVEMG